MRNTLLLLFMSLSFALSAQNREADSLIALLPTITQPKAKNELINRIANAHSIDSNEGLLWNKKGVAFARNNRLDPSGYIDAIGVHHLNRQDYNTALSYFLKAAAEAIKHGNKKTEAGVYDHISIIFDEQDHLDKATGYLKRSMAINMQLNDSLALADNYMSLGIIRSKMKKDREALGYFRHALRIYERKPLDERLAYGYFNIGSVTASLPERYAYYKKAQALWDRFDPKFALAVSSLTNLGETAMLLSQNEALSRQAGRTPRQLLDEANSATAKAIEYSKETRTPYNLMYGYEVMARIKEAEGNTAQALHYTRLQYHLKDSLFSQENKNRIATEESKAQIALRDKQLAFNKLALEARERQFWFLFTAILLFTAMAVLLYLQSRTRKLHNTRLELLNAELEAANRTKARLFGIINHDLRSPVARLISFLHLQKDNTLTAEKKAELEGRTIASAENLLLAMEDLLLWSKGQMDNFSPRVKPVPAAALFEDIRNLYAINTPVAFTFSDPHRLVFDTDADYLKTILRNLTANACRAVSGKDDSRIVWEAYQDNGHKYLAITDNGAGAHPDTFRPLYDDTLSLGAKSGLGLHLVRDLAKAIGCAITVDSNVGVGTVIRLRVS